MSVEPKKWGVIYNPKAGTRKVKKRWKEIKEYMDSREFKDKIIAALREEGNE